MATYLRFTLAEYQAISQVCQSEDLSDDLLPMFKLFLTNALADTWPALAYRIAKFRRFQVGILFEYLKTQRALQR
jgi:hypothetical protein